MDNIRASCPRARCRNPAWLLANPAPLPAARLRGPDQGRGTPSGLQHGHRHWCSLSRRRCGENRWAHSRKNHRKIVKGSRLVVLKEPVKSPGKSKFGGNPPGAPGGLSLTGTESDRRPTRQPQLRRNGLGIRTRATCPRTKKLARNAPARRSRKQSPSGCWSENFIRLQQIAQGKVTGLHLLALEDKGAHDAATATRFMRRCEHLISAPPENIRARSAGDPPLLVEKDNLRRRRRFPRLDMREVTQRLETGIPVERADPHRLKPRAPAAGGRRLLPGKKACASPPASRSTASVRSAGKPNGGLLKIGLRLQSQGICRAR